MAESRGRPRDRRCCVFGWPSGTSKRTAPFRSNDRATLTGKTSCYFHSRCYDQLDSHEVVTGHKFNLQSAHQTLNTSTVMSSIEQMPRYMRLRKQTQDVFMRAQQIDQQKLTLNSTPSCTARPSPSRAKMARSSGARSTWPT